MLNIISFYCNQGCISEFGLFLFGRALSSPPTPYQVLTIKISKTTDTEKNHVTQMSKPYIIFVADNDNQHCSK